MKLRYLIRKLFRILPKIRSKYFVIWNRILFWICGAEFGKNLKVFDRFYLVIHPSGQLKIGDNFTFTSGDAINRMSRNIRGSIFIYNKGKIVIGNHTSISSGYLRSHSLIKIGNYVSIGADCIVIDTDSHNLDYNVRNSTETTSNGYSIDSETARTLPIIIEDNVLIGARSIILKGVTIGYGSVIGAGSVVTKSIPPHTIACGNPAKVVKYLK